MHVLNSSTFVLFCAGEQATLSAAPQKLQATPNAQCNNQSENFFYPFLGTAILTAMLLAAVIIICSCMFCAICDQRSGRKMYEGETPLGRPTESVPPREEPPGNIYDSGGVVPTSASVVPGIVVSERGVGESAPAVESTYSSVIPKVRMVFLCICSQWYALCWTVRLHTLTQQSRTYMLIKQHSLYWN